MNSKVVAARTLKTFLILRFRDFALEEMFNANFARGIPTAANLRLPLTKHEIANTEQFVRAMRDYRRSSGGPRSKLELALDE
jgi:hypothetical protein